MLIVTLSVFWHFLDTCASSRHCASVEADLMFKMQQFADSIGLPTSEGLFGFKPFPEVCSTVEVL